jgi:hypothetical protein
VVLRFDRYAAWLSLLAACGAETLPIDPQGEESSSTSSSESGSSNDDLYVPEIDFSTPPCDAFAQDCPDGEKCVHYSTTGDGNFDAKKCVPVTGNQAPGEPCTYGGTAAATDDCDETGACSDVHEIDGELVGTCLAFCMGTAGDPECPPGSNCTLCANGCPNLCAFACDPLAQDCDPGLACYWASNGFGCMFTMQNIPAGEPCGFVNDCAAGLGCLPADVLPACDGSACCSAFCNVDLGDLQCEAVPGTVCEPFFEEGMAPPGNELVGVCIVPVP